MDVNICHWQSEVGVRGWCTWQRAFETFLRREVRLKQIKGIRLVSSLREISNDGDAELVESLGGWRQEPDSCTSTNADILTHWFIAHNPTYSDTTGTTELDTGFNPTHAVNEATKLRLQYQQNNLLLKPLHLLFSLVKQSSVDHNLYLWICRMK